MMYKYRFFIYGFFILLFGISFGLIFISLSGKEDPIGYSTETKELNGVFSVYDGKVYALVPSNGYYEVKGADPDSFKIIPDSFNDAHIGYDNQHVYAGNIILEGLNPNKLRVLGNNYYTDGSTTYYCARNSEKNESLSPIGFIVRLAGQSMGLADKPQNYWYPFRELPKNKAYQSRPGFALAANDRQVFYEGIELPEADPKQTRPVQIKYWDNDVRDSDEYLTDGKRVYFQNQLLPLTYNSNIYVAGIESDVPSRTAFLIDPQKGMVYADGYSFDETKAPYRLLSLNLKHANQALFVSKDGLYFYNTEDEKAERAGANPFAGNQFQEIAPDIFSSGNKVFFLKASENWARKSGLRGRSTHLMELENIPASSLRKVSNDDHPFGSVWQSGKRYFYFDDMGNSQLMSTAIYEINDIETLKKLLNPATISSDDLRRLGGSAHLTDAAAKTVFKATTSYKNDWWQSYWLIFGMFGLVFLVSLIFRNKRIDPFLIKGDYLIMNNLMFNKYKISDIDKVIFRVVRGHYKVGGSMGEMQVLRKNGKAGRRTTFTTRFTLTSETESQLSCYIRELQSQLKVEGIDSEFLS